VSKEAGTVYDARDALSACPELKNLLAPDGGLCDNYVMRSTRDVVDAESQMDPGYYSDPPLLVLASLASGPKHGHAMIEDIERLCGTRLGPGALYGAIARLEQQGWIKPLPAEERRHPYRITPDGLKVLRAKLTRLNEFSKAGLKRLEAR
jgi:DNA-binding PadR family transcriptional regulator